MAGTSDRVNARIVRILRPISRVRAEEAGTVVLMTACAFSLLTAYYLLKTVREPLILLQGGPEVKLYARAGQILLMMGVVAAYGQLARRVGRAQLLRLVFLFFISNLAIFAALAGTEAPIGLAFFLWVGVFSYTVVAQFWALAADMYSEEQGKRLFPVIGGGSSVGAVVGGLFARWLMPRGPQVLMVAAVVILLGCVGLIVVIDRRVRRAVAAGALAHGRATAVDAPVARERSWGVLARDRYLLLIATLVLLLNWVNSSGEYLLDRVLVADAREVAATGGDAQTFIGTFKADYFVWYNALGVALQLLVVSRVFALVGVRGALFVMPVFALVAYGGVAALPVLPVIRLVKIGENALQYSLQDTTRNALYLVTSRVERFVGKTAVDTVFVRAGAIMAMLVVLAGTQLAWTTTTFAAIDVALAALWLLCAARVRHEHARRSELSEAELAREPRVDLPAVRPPVSRRRRGASRLA